MLYLVYTYVLLLSGLQLTESRNVFLAEATRKVVNSNLAVCVRLSPVAPGMPHTTFDVRSARHAFPHVVAGGVGTNNQHHALNRPRHDDHDRRLLVKFVLAATQQDFINFL